jgi:hypothetical protein
MNTDATTFALLGGTGALSAAFDTLTVIPTASKPSPTPTVTASLTQAQVDQIRGIFGITQQLTADDPQMLEYAQHLADSCAESIVRTHGCLQSSGGKSRPSIDLPLPTGTDTGPDPAIAIAALQERFPDVQAKAVEQIRQNAATVVAASSVADGKRVWFVVFGYCAGWHDWVDAVKPYYHTSCTP